MKRTQTVPNHAAGTRDVKWGVDVLGAILAIIATIVTCTWYLAKAITYAESEARSARVEATAAKTAADSVAKELRDHVNASHAAHSDFLKRSEFYDYMAPEIRRPRETR